MRVRLLGGLEVEGMTERELGSRKGRILLGILAAARGRPVSIDRLADVLWGDDQPARPVDQVGVLVSRLRGVLGQERITRSDAGYALAADWLDVVELSTLAAMAAEALDDGRLGAARVAADAALALHRGRLLPALDGPWIEAERAAVDADLGLARRVAVDAATAAGDHDAVAAVAGVALADDPYDEVLLRALMRAHLAAGRPASALASYARARVRLVEDLGVSPNAETEALHALALAAADSDATVGEGAAPPAPHTAPAGVVGRAAELAELDAALAGVSDGGGALVIVEGDAGIGKTTLVHGWTGALGDRAVVLSGRCDELGRDLPLQPVTDALAEHLQRLGSERAAALLGDDANTMAPLIGPIAGLGATSVSDTEAARTRLFSALVGVLARADPRRPTVLVVEDLHRAGAGTLAWLAFTRRRAERTLVVATTRPGGAEGLDATRRLRLAPLDQGAVVELVGAERAASLHRRSGGHPLLLTALRDHPDDDLPATLPDAVAEKVDSLGPEVARTLRVAAVLGVDCDLELIAQVLGTPIVEVLTRLETATTVGLVREHGSRFAFRHELVRDALAAATGGVRRAHVHREAARVLAMRPAPDPLAVAVHAQAGDEPGLAAAWLVIAARAAAAQFDVDAAEGQLDAAIELSPTAEAHIERARVRMSRLDLVGAEHDARSAIALDGGAAALEVAGWIAYYRRQHDAARAFADEAVNRAEDATISASALALAARIRHGSGDLEGAVERLSTVRDAPPSVQGVADVWLAQVRNHQGRPHDALAALARPMVDPEALAHPWAPLHLRFCRIAALGQLGRVAEALQVADDLDAVLEREGAVGERFRGPAANVGAWIRRGVGRFEEADERNLVAVEATGGITGPSAGGFEEAHYVALLDLADGCLQRGDWAGAQGLLGRLAPVDTWGGTMAWHQRHRLELLRARLSLADGDADGAAERAAAVAEDAARRGARRYELLARAVVGLSDPTVPDDDLDGVVRGLGTCAVIDGWPLIVALADRRRRDGWRREAERMAGTVVAHAGALREDARRYVEQRLTV